MVSTICRLHEEDRLLFELLLLTQHGYLRKVARDERNPVEIICRTVSAAMDAGEIPTANPTLLAGAIIGVLVQTATFCLYGRMIDGLKAHEDELVTFCLKITS